MYHNMIYSNPIRVTQSSKFDKTTKGFTVCFALIVIILSVIVSVLQGEVNINSNQNDYQKAIGLYGYIALNVNSTPIKNVFFRDLFCDENEETIGLFPWQKNNTLNYWQQQLICISRYSTISYTNSTCSSGFFQCGIYCISNNEGMICPITKISIQPITILNADQQPQQLTNSVDPNNPSRGLFLERDQQSQGIYNIEVAVNTYPCINSYTRNLGEITTTVLGPHYDQNSQKCDQYGEDRDNTLRIEQIPFQIFLQDNLQRLNVSAPNSTSVCTLFQRDQIQYAHTLQKCTYIDYLKIYRIKEYADNIEEIGFIYMIITSIISCLIVIILMVELIKLKGKIHLDLKIISVLFKALTIILCTVFLIEGGLIFNQLINKTDIENYFKGFASNNCFVQPLMNTIFAQFPELLSQDQQIFIQFFYICMIFVGVLESLLLIFYIIQMIQWCCSKKSHGVTLHPRQFAEEDFKGLQQNFEVIKEKVSQQEIDRFEGERQFELSNIKKSSKY